VLVRAGHTEAGCDLTAMAGLTPAAVICEILKPDGTMARLPDLVQFAQTHQLKIGTIADLIQYRSEHETMVERLVERNVTTPWGEFKAVAYRDRASDAPHLALVHGEIQADHDTLVRVHEPTSVLDLLCEGATSHSWTIPEALRTIAAAPRGVLVLLNCHGEADLLFAQFDAWARSPDGAPSTPAVPDGERHGLRTFGIGAQILRDLGVGKARLLARPRKMPSMAGFSLTITGYHNEPGVPGASH
jgi:3,4-dihydroxy 2-butanone 4-phosphate synthase/GTP cyclohydrolase II